ncbi:MAG: phosphatase PAP2 family protein [Candidatus Neomarinimicrobiota bacterium]
MLEKILSFIFIFNSFMYAQPDTKDYIRLGAELSIFSYTQFFYHQTNTKPNLNSPNNVDSFIREKIHWGNSQNELAKEVSDILLYGVFVGGIPISSMYLKNYNLLLINLEILSINGLITNVVKYTTQRQRPYSFYLNKNDEESYKSFFSGHTSTAFAIGTSTAKMLTQYSNIDKRIIWLSTLGLASVTGYLRIAADKHYFSDVVAGAVVGSFLGNKMFDRLTNKYQKIPILGQHTPKFCFNPHNVKIIIPL